MEEDPEEEDVVASAGGDDAAESDLASVLKLIEPLPKDQIVEPRRHATVKHADLLQQIVRAADVDPSHRKIFVHGLDWEVHYFSSQTGSHHRRNGEIVSYWVLIHRRDDFVELENISVLKETVSETMVGEFAEGPMGCESDRLSRDGVRRICMMPKRLVWR